LSVAITFYLIILLLN